MHPTALERVQSRFHKRVIHANGCDLNLQFLDPKLLFYFLLDGVPGLGAQAANALIGIIARKSSQVHAGNRPQKPRHLPFLFYGSSRDMGLNAALDCARIDSHFSDPIQIEGNAGIREQRLSGERSNRTAAVCSAWCEIPKLIVIDRHRVLSAK
jgi:hypothetical protein